MGPPRRPVGGKQIAPLRRSDLLLASGSYCISFQIRHPAEPPRPPSEMGPPWRPVGGKQIAPLRRSDLLLVTGSYCISFQIRHECYEHGFLRVHAILGLVEDGALRSVDHSRSDFLTAVRRQAMQKDCVRRRV